MGGGNEKPNQGVREIKNVEGWAGVMKRGGTHKQKA
jgi:hypothetical protein